ncbi:DNA topology modulation protein FlaR [Deinococcus alpinitundrae]|uniref:DNA topology modulation protein FlaR n=1 Tax=Deinococcus alpinitundrae TaxID=468913 RepID=UPI001ED8D26E|nr:DNA topology modulation protein FlaR [Deinococcus alpinitundrae]
MMRRVMVLGSPGAGKSTFAQRLAQTTGPPLIYLDDLYWFLGWVRPEQAIWQAQMQAATAPERWILDGNNADTLKIRAEQADTAVVLVYSRWLCLFRAVTRALLHRRLNAKHLGKEPLDWAFLRFIWTFPQLGAQQLEQLRETPKLQVVVLRNALDARAFLKQLSS